MYPDEARALAAELFRKNKVVSFATFDINKRLTSSLGRALLLGGRKKQQIELGFRFVVSNSKEVVTEILLHEIAHVIAFTKDGDFGHGAAWIKACKKLGIEPIIRYKTEKDGGKIREYVDLTKKSVDKGKF